MKINRTENEIVYLTYENIEATGLVHHGFSTRVGGVSKGVLGSMNLSYSRGDEPSNVTENFNRIAVAIGFDASTMVLTHQTHTTNVKVVGREQMGSGFLRENDFTDVDGLVTNEEGVTLSVFFADCVPLMFLDPVKKAIGLSHSGWRGTVGRIGKVTLDTMREEYGTNPEDVIAVIGPSICQDCYEVSADVAEQFMVAFDKKHHGQILKKGKEEGKYQLNLQESNRIIMLEAGVKYENIEMPGICTCCNPQFLFSHRFSNGKRGNMGAFICLDSKNSK